MGKHRYFCWALYMCHCNILDVNVITILFWYLWPWYQCTRICIEVALIDIFIRLRNCLFYTIIRSGWHIGSGWQTDAGVSIHLTLLMLENCQDKWRNTIWHGMSDSWLEFQNVWNDVFWTSKIWVIYCLGLCVPTVWNNGEEVFQYKWYVIADTGKPKETLLETGFENPDRKLVYLWEMYWCEKYKYLMIIPPPCV